MQLINLSFQTYQIIKLMSQCLFKVTEWTAFTIRAFTKWYQELPAYSNRLFLMTMFIMFGDGKITLMFIVNMFIKI